jgi:hypothetical protein
VNISQPKLRNEKFYNNNNNNNNNNGRQLIKKQIRPQGLILLIIAS